MAEVPGTLEGWSVLHDFRRLDWARWKQLGGNERDSVLSEAISVLSQAAEVSDSVTGASAFYSIVGHKADLLMLHLRPTVEELGKIGRASCRERVYVLV